MKPDSKIEKLEIVGEIMYLGQIDHFDENLYSKNHYICCDRLRDITIKQIF